MEWKDITTYSQSDAERIPDAWEIRIGLCRICVHRHVHYPPNIWLLTCEPFFYRKELPRKDIARAKTYAIALVMRKLLETFRKLEEAA